MTIVDTDPEYIRAHPGEDALRTLTLYLDYMECIWDADIIMDCLNSVLEVRAERVRDGSAPKQDPVVKLAKVKHHVDRQLRRAQRKVERGQPIHDPSRFLLKE